jgi:hypothetical protein
VNSEVTEAFSRWLAGTQEWSHNSFLCLRDEIGLGLLVVENAERCSVTVDKLEWRYGQHFYATIGGYSFEIDGPWWDESTATKWTADRSGSPALEAPTFPELFDKIATAALEIQAEETVEVDDDAGSEWTPNFWHCGPPLFTGVPECGGM